MSMGSGGAGGGRPGMMSEINVTPLVDVMLVLLIIFMVTAPMMTQGLDVNLPKVDSQALQTEEQQTILTVKSDGAIFLDEFEVPEANLAFQVAEVMKTKGSQTVFLKADQNTPYGNVAGVMAQLRKAGITSVGLVTEPADRTASPETSQPAPPQRTAAPDEERPAQ
ncbi:protein TolR [Deltaproteobacteria bacterium OttesenSCG-928-M10]|nr:protein TolR [Deltaproteobacteria bacterium OttesenSCG-928-M10]